MSLKLVALGLALLLQEPALPALTGRVVDTAGILSAGEEAGLTARLEQIERETSVQIVIATVTTLDDVPIEDYSIRLAEAWQIGQADKDNGIVVLVVPNDRKMHIEVGYGLEAVIPDSLAGRIIRERMTPAFRQNDYHGGLLAAVDGLELAARREYPEAPAETTGARRGLDVGVLLFAYFVLGFFGDLIGVWLAVIGGAILLPLLGGAIAASLGWWAAPVGGLLGLVTVGLLRGADSVGGWTYSGGGGGGGFSGGGGGFSGGGGSFGGGGASGSW